MTVEQRLDQLERRNTVEAIQAAWCRSTTRQVRMSSSWALMNTATAWSGRMTAKAWAESLSLGRRTGQRRYMDDFVIMAPTRHRLRRAIKEVHAAVARLGLCLHEQVAEHRARSFAE